MRCGRGACEYRAYLPRARWIRDANDSYFTAMTYPQGLPYSNQPTDIHDATWGVLSAVYGGAVHPTAEGHAAMADAALPAAAAVLQLDAAAPEVTQEPAAPIRRAPGAAEIARSARKRRRIISRARRSSWRRDGRFGLAPRRLAACAGRYFATIAGSSWAIAVSGNRYQVSSLPNSEMPR